MQLIDKLLIKFDKEYHKFDVCILGSFSVTAIMCALASDEVMLQHTGVNDYDTAIMGNNDTIPSITYVEITTTLAFTTGIMEVFKLFQIY